MYKKFALIGLVIALVSGIALAKAVMVDLLPYPADPIEPDASGKAMLNLAQKGDDGKTEVQVNCWGLMPEADYTVYVGTEGGSWTEVCTFTTNKQGTGSCHSRIEGDFTGDSVAVNNANNETVLLGP